MTSIPIVELRIRGVPRIFGVIKTVVKGVYLTLVYLGCGCAILGVCVCVWYNQPLEWRWRNRLIGGWFNTHLKLSESNLRSIESSEVRSGKGCTEDHGMVLGAFAVMEIEIWK